MFLFCALHSLMSPGQQFAFCSLFLCCFCWIITLLLILELFYGLFAVLHSFSLRCFCYSTFLFTSLHLMNAIEDKNTREWILVFLSPIHPSFFQNGNFIFDFLGSHRNEYNFFCRTCAHVAPADCLWCQRDFESDHFMTKKSTAALPEN